MGKGHFWSIVVPTAFRVRGREIEKRALVLARSGYFSQHELIFSHGTRSDNGRFCHALAATGARVVTTTLATDNVPLGLLRNRGAQVATGNYVMFWDVDLLPSEAFLADLRRWVTHSQRPFTIVPCLYATALGVRYFARGRVFDIEGCRSAFYGHRRELVSHLALNTSTVAIEREHFTAMGGFDERFFDHGLEDLDLLLRLSLNDGTLPIPRDLLTDNRHQSPAFSTGFRSVLNLLSLPVFLEGIATLHQWHRRPRDKGYYARRPENWRLFEDNVRTALERPRSNAGDSAWSGLIRGDGTLDSVLAVHRVLSRASQPPADPSAFFDEVPQHYFHPDRKGRQLFRALVKAFSSKRQDRPPKM